MACPLFLPSTPLGDFEDVYSGECASDRETAITQEVLRDCCNRGYARGVCERAALTDADSYRFLIKSATHGMVEVAWSIERNHHPVAVGTCTVAESSTASDEPLERQARACALTRLLTRLPRP